MFNNEKDKQKYINRFWTKVDIQESDKCWDWLAGTFASGYGCFAVHGFGERAHRVSWTSFNGDIPIDKLVLHRCDNRLCVNPNHLYLGSRSDNQRDRADSDSLKFTPDMIETMKKMYYEYEMTQKNIAKVFKTDQSVISRAINDNPRVGG